MSLLEMVCEVLKEYKEDENIVYKKCHSPNSLAVLRKCQDSKTSENRSSIVDKRYAQFRANKLYVVKIATLPNLEFVESAKSLRQSYFEYNVDEMVEESDFEEDVEIISGRGLHYFKSITAALCFGFIPNEIYEYYDGIWYSYNWNGKLMAIYNLKKGHLFGEQIIFTEDGKKWTYLK